MGAVSRRKGCRGEQEIVRLAHGHGLSASRESQNAQASDSAVRRCDCLIANKRAQVKVAADGYCKLYAGLQDVELLFVRGGSARVVVCGACRMVAGFVGTARSGSKEGKGKWRTIKHWPNAWRARSGSIICGARSNYRTKSPLGGQGDRSMMAFRLALSAPHWAKSSKFGPESYPYRASPVLGHGRARVGTLMQACLARSGSNLPVSRQVCRGAACPDAVGGKGWLTVSLTVGLKAAQAWPECATGVQPRWQAPAIEGAGADPRLR
jgi:hypothetical protein